MVRLLAIPNDATASYARSDALDFLSEFNPRSSDGKRFFDDVRFLNWKDTSDSSYCGVESYAFLDDKSSATALMGSLSRGERSFSSPLFSPLFASDFDSVLDTVKAYDPHIVRAFNTHFAAELGYMVSSELAIPLVVSAHDPSRLTSAIGYADNLVCISDDLASICKSSYGIASEDISIIPDGVDMDRIFYPRDVSSHGDLPMGSFPKIVSVGRIVPSKNIATLLDALSLFKTSHPHFVHYHLGKGEPEAVREIEDYAASRGLSQHSHFIGGIQKNDLPTYYSWADVYCLPTRWEGLGRAQIESLACGTPVITTNSPPMNAIVRDGYNGLLVDSESAESISCALRTCFSDSDVLSRLSMPARLSVKQFSVDTVMDAHVTNYQEVLSRYGS